jgi:membrane protease YdiL (CAAX protease family)
MARGPETAASAFSGVFATALTASEALWLLASFGFLVVGTLVAANLFQGRGIATLTGPPALAAVHFARVLRALALLYAAIWLILLQVGAEELFFRGYLQQQLAARFRSPAIWIGLPAALFAWGHYQPEETGGNALAVAVWAGIFAAAAADLTARTGTLGAAIGLHFANNAISILFLSLPGPVSGLALYTYPFAADDPALGPLFLVDLGVIGVSWLAARVALRV